MTRRAGRRAAHTLLVDAARDAHRHGDGTAVHVLAEMRSFRTLTEWHDHANTETPTEEGHTR